MALHDEILREIIVGRVPYRFRTADLKKHQTSTGRFRVGDQEYSENSINTIPRNHSERPDGSGQGDYVKKGRRAAFVWYGNGEYELVLNREHSLTDAGQENDEFDATEGEDESPIRSPRDSSKPWEWSGFDRELAFRIAEQEEFKPAATVVRYIAKKPFQGFYRKSPVGTTKSGWGERLEAYFWPVPERDWATTRRIVDELASQVRLAVGKLDGRPGDTVAAEELLDAFKRTCVWGGVKLPEPDASKLAKEVLLARLELSRGRLPPAPCRLNSAWTKLYALVLPDTCVIYDSRVATAITSILDPAMQQICDLPEWQSFSTLGTVPGRGGSRPRDLRWTWPNGYRAWASQAAANRLCREVRDDLNRWAASEDDCRKIDDDSPWTLREIEAVLFMEGY